MCRIAGIVDFNRSLSNKLENLLISIRDSMIHGGPDDAGLFISEDRKIALGNRRLSIIDLSKAGHQPMHNKKKDVWITYNGEIYNYKELRLELSSIGYEFVSNSDTEVILVGYEAWGIEKLLSRLRGMFAFAIYDSRNGTENFKLYLARDRFGIKPLYYYHDINYLIFASEVKALSHSSLVPNEESMEALVKFLQLGSIPVPLTTIKNVYSIPAGHYLELSNKNVTIEQYWNISQVFKSSTNAMKYDEVVELVKNALDEVVQLHLISDAPLGIFLSGGLDSSALCAVASKIQMDPITTLSIVFDEANYNEAQYSRLISKKYNTRHNEVILRSADFLNEIPSIISAMDQPTIDGVNTYFISKAAKEVGLKVVLSGVGADEVFLGYRHFKTTQVMESILKGLNNLSYGFRGGVIDAIAQIDRRFEKLQFIKDPSDENAYLLFRGLFTPAQVQRLTGITSRELKRYGSTLDLKSFSNKRNSLLEYFNYLEFWHYLQDQLLKDTDFMSMTHSVEVRVPFLDHKLVECVISNASNMRLGKKNKSLLIDALKDSVPREIYSRPKMGFIFPFGEWFKSDSALLEEQCLGTNLLDNDSVHKIWKDVRDERLHWSRGWALFVLANVFMRRKEKIAT